MYIDVCMMHFYLWRDITPAFSHILVTLTACCMIRFKELLKIMYPLAGDNEFLTMYR